MIWKPMFSGISVLMALLCFSIFAVVCSLAAKKAGWHSLRALGFGIFLVLLRCLLPFEVSSARIIHMGKLLTGLDIWFRSPQIGSLTAVQLLCVLWGLGSLALLTRLLVLLCRQRRIIRETRVPEDGPLPRFCQTVAQEAGCSAPGTVCMSPNFRTAMMTGFLRPCILLPQNADKLPERELRLILLHEYTHFQSRDLWIKLGMELLCCLLWWNPGAYLLRTSVGQLLELRCDSRVCAHLSEQEKTSYAETLLHMLQGGQGKNPCFAAGFFGYPNGERIKQRFRQITPVSPKPKRRGLSILIAALAVALFIGSYSFVFQPYALPAGVGSGYEVDSDLDGSLILRYPDGTLQVYIDNELYGAISEDQLNQEPFCYMQIYDVQITSEKDVMIP